MSDSLETMVMAIATAITAVGKKLEQQYGADLGGIASEMSALSVSAGRLIASITTPGEDQMQNIPSVDTVETPVSVETDVPLLPADDAPAEPNA